MCNARVTLPRRPLSRKLSAELRERDLGAALGRIERGHGCGVARAVGSVGPLLLNGGVRQVDELVVQVVQQSGSWGGFDQMILQYFSRSLQYARGAKDCSGFRFRFGEN